MSGYKVDLGVEVILGTVTHLWECICHRKQGCIECDYTGQIEDTGCCCDECIDLVEKLELNEDDNELD